ncbi:MAG: hypothetical protein AB7N65_15080 [Vicinamibacterales bacterium]
MNGILFGIALAGIALLALLDIFHLQLEQHWFSFSLPFWHHLAALVAGASTAGILFERFAREHFLHDLKKSFLSDEDLVGLFAGEERQKWVRTLLEKQLRDDPTHSLSGAIFSDVVQPFMSKRKFRSRMHYSVELSDPPVDEWRYGAIHLPATEYVMMTVDLDMTQHLAGPHKELNVSIVFGTAVEELQRAFDDEACIYREHLMLLKGAHDADRWKEFADEVAREPHKLAQLGLATTMFVDGSVVEHSRIERDGARLRIWFPHSGAEEAKVSIHLTAPYPREMRHFEVVFGEPTSSAHVTFKPGPFAAPDAVTVIDFLQGQRRVGRNCRVSEKAVDVTFPAPHGSASPRWILPRSGLLLLWRTDPRHSNE